MCFDIIEKVKSKNLFCDGMGMGVSEVMALHVADPI